MTERHQQALQQWGYHGAHLAERYQERLDHLAAEVTGLEENQRVRDEYLRQHPDALDRLAELDHAIDRASELERRNRLERAHGLSLHDRQSPSLGHSIQHERTADSASNARRFVFPPPTAALRTAAWRRRLGSERVRKASRHNRLAAPRRHSARTFRVQSLTKVKIPEPSLRAVWWW